MNSYSSRKVIPAIAVFVVFFFLLSTNRLSNSPGSSASYFAYQVSPKDQFLSELEQNPEYRENGLHFQPLQPLKLPAKSKVLQQLETLFPYDPTLPIPKRLWQMWKVGLDDDEFPEPFRSYRQTWIDTNPEYEHIVKTNEECDTMVAELYADIPDIIHAYNIMPQTILKCDFSRYLILFAYGGIYADIDTRSLQPIKDWIPSQPEYLNKKLNAGLVVGIESDRSDFIGHFARRVQINTWTIMARRAHPMLAMLIDTITQETLRREEVGLLDYMLGRDLNDNVINWTGPGIFSDITFKYLNTILQSDSDNYELLVNFPFFTGLQSPVAIDDVMVLHRECMRPKKVSKTGEFTDPNAYVKHVGSGVWKKSMKDANQKETKTASS